MSRSTRDFPGFQRCLWLMRRSDPQLQEDGFAALLPHVADYVPEPTREFSVENDHGLRCDAIACEVQPCGQVAKGLDRVSGRRLTEDLDTRRRGGAGWASLPSVVHLVHVGGDRVGYPAGSALLPSVGPIARAVGIAPDASEARDP